MLRAKETINLIELQEWCREYTRTPRCLTQDPVRRFAIGVYQIYQGMVWKTTDSAYESFAASAIHFIMVAESLKAYVEMHMLDDLRECSFYDYRNMLHCLSKSQQMVIYATDAQGVGRKSRYKPEILSCDIANLISVLFGRIPADKLAEAIYHAMEVMNGET